MRDDKQKYNAWHILRNKRKTPNQSQIIHE